MHRYPLRFSLLMTLAFTLLALLPRLQPAFAGVLLPDLLPTDDCRMPCWQGIRPGGTSFAHLRAVLDAHPWISSTPLSYYNGQRGWVGLVWNSARPPWLIQSAGSGMRIDQNLVTHISIETNLRLGDLWIALGPPDWTTRFQAQRAQHVVHGYMHLGLTVAFDVRCLGALDRVWRAPIKLTWTPFMGVPRHQAGSRPVDFAACERGR